MVLAKTVPKRPIWYMHRLYLSDQVDTYASNMVLAQTVPKRPMLCSQPWLLSAPSFPLPDRNKRPSSLNTQQAFKATYSAGPDAGSLPSHLAITVLDIGWLQLLLRRCVAAPNFTTVVPGTSMMTLHAAAGCRIKYPLLWRSNTKKDTLIYKVN